MYLFMVVVSCFLIDSSVSSIVPFIKPCKFGDHDCLLAANLQVAFPYFADGISELGISAVEPMKLQNVTIDQGLFKIAFPDMNIVGTRKCKVAELKQNLQDSTLKIALDCPLKITGIYKFTGKICFFDVNDEGDFKIETESIKVTITAKTDKIIGKEGKRYLRLKNYEYSFEPVKSVHFQLDNLFAGDVSKALPLLEVLNSDWKAKTSQYGGAVTDVAVKEFYGVIQKFFYHIPIDQLE